MSRHSFLEIFDRSALLQRQQLSFCPTTVKDLTAWTSSINFTKIGDCAESLLRALVELAELNCPETLRFNLLQVLHPSVEHILKALEYHFIYQIQNHTDRQNQLIELHTRIQLCFTHLYIDICYRTHFELNQIKSSIFNRGNKHNLKMARMLACYYALQQLSLLFVQQQKRYSPAFIDQWRYTHALYQLAQLNNEQHINVNQLQGTHYPITNIQQAYTQILLIEIFNSLQIRPIEIEALFQCSFEWIQRINISITPNSLTRYMLDTKLDSAPLLMQKLDHYDPDLFISTQALLEHINNTIQYPSKVMSKLEQQHLSPALQFHIQNILGTRHSERRYERHAYSAELELGFDVETTYFYLTQQLALKQNTTANTQETLPLDQEHFIPSAFEAKLNQEAIQLYRAQVLDMSSGGYRIHWEHERTQKLNTGQFIQLREHTEYYWKVGVIRWIKQSLMKTYAMGIEILATRALPCILSHADQDQSQDHQAIHALLLHHDQSQPYLFSIVSSNHTLLNEQAIHRLKLLEHDIHIRLEKVLIMSHSFIQYQCQITKTEHIEQVLACFNMEYKRQSLQQQQPV